MLTIEILNRVAAMSDKEYGEFLRAQLNAVFDRMNTEQKFIATQLVNTYYEGLRDTGALEEREIKAKRGNAGRPIHPHGVRKEEKR